jgi:protoporphyrinogen oxidase
VTRIGILGGGISGIALAAQLGENVEVLEKRDCIGGLSGSIVDSGFTFDAAGPHIMFSRNREVLDLMVKTLGDNVHQRRRENRIWFRDRLVKYPFENDLAALEKEDAYDCLIHYLDNPRASETPTNLAQWSYVTFGSGISEKYFLPYNRKIWNYDPEKIGLEFVARIPKPPMQDVVKSAIGIPTEGYLHQLHFYYPIHGGYESLVHAFAKSVRGRIETGWKVALVERDGESWRVTSSTGDVRTYDVLVSTLPIHDLLPMWSGAPADAIAAAGRLRYNSLINVLLGVSEDRGYPYTALYVPDPEIPFHRLSFPKAFSEACVPDGSSAIMAEITTHEGDADFNATDDAILDSTIGHLQRMGLVDPDTISYRRVVRFQYGYPVYDIEYRANVEQMRESVRSTGMNLLGRFAEFDYINSDVCVERALALAARLDAS